jgi:Transposase/zinc-finger of transposase IS204/IS1001/IS1096/IS1165
MHGHYERTVADLPCAGRRVILALTVRKFVCRTPTCPQRIFTERLPELVHSYARMTNRLREALIALGLAASAQVCSRLAPKLGLQLSPPTLLRYLRTVSCAAPTSVRILGIDDWAWKKGQLYGTLLVDLERRCPIEILPDRREETVRVWLLAHPEIEVISRDRGGEYAAAAKKGAPQAQQIADKFHLLLNLREKLKELMGRKQKLLPHVEPTIPKTMGEEGQGRSSAEEELAHQAPWKRRSPFATCLPIHERLPLASCLSRQKKRPRRSAVRIATLGTKLFIHSIASSSPSGRLPAG